MQGVAPRGRQIGVDRRPDEDVGEGQVPRVAGWAVDQQTGSCGFVQRSHWIGHIGHPHGVGESTPRTQHGRRQHEVLGGGRQFGQPYEHQEAHRVRSGECIGGFHQGFDGELLQQRPGIHGVTAGVLV